MLEKLVITNFQCHEKLELELEKHISVLVGATDSGKSSILRALKWLMTNTPSGMSFLRKGSKKVKVSLLVDQSGRELIGAIGVSGGVGSVQQKLVTTVTRVRSSRKNLYFLNKQKYQAFGQGTVPDDIAKLLNVSAINFQSQHSPPFWLTLTPGQVAKELNSVVNLESIDSALAYVASTLRKSKLEEEISEKRLQEARAHRDSLKWVGEAHRDLRALEQKYTKREETRLKRSRLEDELKALESTAERKRSFSASIRGLRRVMSLAQGALEMRGRCRELQDSIQKLTREQERWKKLQEEIQRAEQKLAKEGEGKCPLCLSPWPYSQQISTSARKPLLPVPQSPLGMMPKHASSSK